jgi:hypothetical protein
VINDFIGKTNVGNVIQHMWDQEKEHKKKFDELLPKYRARPTVMLPIWNVAGFALGVGMYLILFLGNFDLRNSRRRLKYGVSESINIVYIIYAPTWLYQSGT